MDVKDMKVVGYLGKTIDCSCGRVHTVDLKTVEISKDALGKVAQIMSRDGYKKPFIVADRNTYQVAAKRLESLLASESIAFSTFIFDEEELVPDETALGRLVIDFNPDCDLMIAVGAGTINDIARFVSYRLQVPYYIVATAPSMDGYASSVAPLIRNNLKTTFECHMPQAIIADLDIVAQAPQEMIAAGFGDVLGKYTCLADWGLSAIINDEYYCETIVGITRASLEKTISLRDGIAKGDPQSIGELMNALVLAGIAMSYAGNSRPASGSEHHLSHFWEMRLLFADKPAILHGTKVGIGAVVIAGLYERLRKENLDTDSIAKIVVESDPRWVDEINRAFLDAAPEVIELENRVGKNSSEQHRIRIQSIAQRWEQILEVLESVPEPAVLAELLESVGGLSTHQGTEISDEWVKDAIRYAKEIRPRYTILQLLWDLDLLSDYAGN